MEGQTPMTRGTSKDRIVIKSSDAEEYYALDVNRINVIIRGMDIRSWNYYVSDDTMWSVPQDGGTRFKCKIDQPASAYIEKILSKYEDRFVKVGDHYINPDNVIGLSKTVLTSCATGEKSYGIQLRFCSQTGDYNIDMTVHLFGAEPERDRVFDWAIDLFMSDGA